MTSHRMIVQCLQAAQRWLREQTVPTATGSHCDRELLAGCLDILGQSVASYGAFAARHRKHLRAGYTTPRGRKARLRLLDLTISDVEANAWGRYVAPWQLERWAKSKKVSKVD